MFKLKLHWQLQANDQACTPSFEHKQQTPKSKKIHRKQQQTTQAHFLFLSASKKSACGVNRKTAARVFLAYFLLYKKMFSRLSATTTGVRAAARTLTTSAAAL